jgi:hypothetical protein
MAEIPLSLPVRDIDARHPHHFEMARAWDEIDLLYRGGSAIRAQADRFLVRRPKELEEVYRARLGRFTYQNILGTALGWYMTALFEREPSILLADPDGGPLPEDAASYYGALMADATRAGTSWVDFWRQAILFQLLYGSAFVLVDLPAPGEEMPATLAEQRALGYLDPYLVLWDPRQVINWGEDARGRLAWVVMAATEERRQFGSPAAAVDRWYYFDQTEFRVYEASRARDGKRGETAELAAAGPHALAAVGRVPVRRFTVPHALWLGDRVHLQVIDHLNQDNTYAWALFMANLPVPFVKGDWEHDPKVSETAIIQLAENGEFGWAEPAGTSFEHSAARIATLREEIYRQMYLVAQARSTAATPAAASGLSKQMDMAPTRDVLRGLGDILRGQMRAVLEDVAAARGEEVRVEVRGFDFADEEVGDELARAEAIEALRIPSATLRREMQKRVARAVLRDAAPETLAAVEREIDEERPEDTLEAAVAARIEAFHRNLTNTS